ncbi:MAG: response regulator [Pleurocapsa minor HA4230-MV1]|jgi:chemotaxis family two-component system sensor histidine kinase/response regulator PixL|nr:response regulator [Pleurocapsa minor HA4230-MV1]
MSLNPDIRDRAYQFFVEEAQELLQLLETGLLELRQDHSIPKVHELMRAAHSIKGGAASVELNAIELLAHRLEDFFKALYSDRVDFDPELESLLLQGYDCLSNPLLEQIQTGSFDEEAALLKAEPVFAALEVRLAEALKNADNYLPSSNDLGVDIVASIFEVDVVKALDRLQSVSLNPHDYEPAAELGATLEMFAGFAELFNLSGFSDIVQTAQAALQLNPQAALTIIQVMVADCTLATEQVLAGDRERGGTVSLALIELAQSKVAETDTDCQIASPQDHFGSTTPLTDDLVTDDEIALDSDNWSNVTDNEALAEDIFGNFAEPLNTTDELNQIFNLVADQAVTDQTETDNDVFASEEIATEFDHLWSSVSDPETATDNLSQIFNLVADQALTAQTEKETDNDVFTHEQISDSEHLWSDVADNEVLAEDIFGASAIDIEPEPAVDDVEQKIEQPEITTTIESIADIFDSLPSAKPDSLLLSSQSPPKPKAQASTTANTSNTASKLSVRVDLDRLERMNNLVGELTINRNSLALQNEQLQENVFELEQKCWRFRGVTKQLREISDQMLLEARSRIPNAPTLDSDTETEFDALELDSYSLLYSSLQEVLEEMVQLEESVEDITLFAQQSDRTINSQGQMLRQMRDELMWVRMLPLEQILQRFPRILRDLSSKHHKSVDLKLKGTGVLVDKAVLEKLSDPLLHLLRNGFDHGIEDPQLRIQQGKSATGLIEIQAYYQGNQTVIEVKDDGQGLDLARITQKGIEQGLISPQEAASASQERLFELIFEPGFSTASQVSELSGRGVGMNIVRSQVETLKGKIGVTSTRGRGSTFTLRLPLTLTIAKLLICSLGLTAFAIPADSIEEIIIPTAEQIKLANGQQFLFLKGKLIPIYALPEILSYNCPIPDTDSSSKAFKTIAPPEDWAAPLLLLRRGQQLFALEVVSLLSEQELVIKPYGKAIAPPSYSYGCTILSDGSLIPAFDGSALISMILGESQGTSITQSYIPKVKSASESVQSDRGMVSEVATQLTSCQTIMIVDDSTALRRTMALTLEKEGYRVVQKKDGKEALNGFKQHPEIDLIICDVEMPVMNGFEFLGMRRRDSALAQVPTFMLTSRSGAKHRNLAQQLGADGYFTKPYVEQDFIQAVKQILEGKKPSENKTQTAIAIKTKTILIVDDSSALRRTLALSLEQKGYRVLQSRDGAEGLNQLRSNLQTDLVICDIEMPNVNGFEFLTLRRQEPPLSQIPVVMLTSRGTEKHRSLAASLGAAGFFTKPYIEDKFIAEIEQYLRP